MSGGISATTIALLATAAVGTYAAIQQGNQQDAQLKYQAEQTQADANAAKGQAQVEAAKIREATTKQQAAARASLADSGVNVDVGSAELIQTEIQKNGEQDALTTILNGSNAARKLDAQAQGLSIAGNNAQTAGYFRGATSALSAFSPRDGWKPSTKAAA